MSSHLKKQFFVSLLTACYAVAFAVLLEPASPLHVAVEVVIVDFLKRFHIVPNHRLTSADLHRLRPGTVLPTLAGEGQSLVVTHYATDSASKSNDVRIKYIPIKEPDVVVNSRIAVHGVYVPFPRLHLADLAVASATDQTNGTCSVGGPFGDCASSAITSPNPKRQVAPGE